MNAIIVDDSKKARNLLKLMLMELAPDINVVEEAEDVDSAMDKVLSINPDILFLDIEMPGKSGLQFAEILKNSSFTGKIIFITAFNEHALKAFRLSAIDYLLKPLQEEDLLEALTKARLFQPINLNQQLTTLKHNLENIENSKLVVPIVGGADYINLNDILFLEADGAYVKIHLSTNDSKVYSKNLKYFEHALTAQSKFIRTHRSYIVNTDHIKTLSKGDQPAIHLMNEQIIPISRDKKSSVFQQIKS